MDYKFKLNEQPAQPVLSMRTITSVGNLPQELGKAYGAIIEYLNEIGEKPLDAAFAAYYNMDMENLDVEMGFPVSKPVAGKGGIKAGEIPAGKQVSYLYKGPYNGMEPVYNAMISGSMKMDTRRQGCLMSSITTLPTKCPRASC